MKDGLEALGRLRLQAIALLGLVFVVGALAGAAIERGWHGRGGPARRMGPPPNEGRRSPGGLPPDFSRELRLTAPQEARIRAILERSRPRTDSLMEALLPRLKAVTDSVRAEIRAELTEEQRKVFDEHPPRLFGGPGRTPPDGGPGGGHPPDEGPPQPGAGERPDGGPGPGGPSGPPR